MTAEKRAARARIEQHYKRIMHQLNILRAVGDGKPDSYELRGLTLGWLRHLVNAES
jgi:hypothetical protein